MWPSSRKKQKAGEFADQLIETAFQYSRDPKNPDFYHAQDMIGMVENADLGQNVVFAGVRG